jgi:ectoine hydroxylase-related dioxygenase (phytanoyl-CoA dioxygenase family)
LPPADSTWKPGDDPARLCKVEQPQRADAGLLAAVANAEIGRVAAAAMGAEAFVQVWWVQLLLKPGAAGVDGPQVGWHQDLSYWGNWAEGSELATAWLALSEVDEEAGPMRFVPGSHAWGLRPGGDFYGQEPDVLRERLGAGREWREVPATLPPGGFSLHHRLLIHGSGANVGPRDRLSLALHLRTEKSRVAEGAWEARYLGDPAVCPVIWRA